MAQKNLILLSLDDSKIKKIANVVSNDSCRKILDYLSNKEATESELAENLQIPISTVHYNLQQLMEAGLIVVDEFHYSEKGREVNHYKLANKYIIITPKKIFGIKEKLKSILPVALIAIGTAGIIQLFINYFSRGTLSQELGVAKSAISERVTEAVPIAASEVAPIVSKTTPSLLQNMALWFLVGALFALIVYFVWSWFRKDFD
jgi:DNA-binding transcriptional ArsR family regulator